MSARSRAACRSGSPVRLIRKPAAASVPSTGTSSTGQGQCGFWLVISTRPGPAGGRNASTDARSGALSKISSHGAAKLLPGQRAPRRLDPGYRPGPGRRAGRQVRRTRPPAPCCSQRETATPHRAYPGAGRHTPPPRWSCRLPPSPDNDMVHGTELHQDRLIAGHPAPRAAHRGRRPLFSTGRGASRTGRPAVACCCGTCSRPIATRCMATTAPDSTTLIAGTATGFNGLCRVGSSGGTFPWITAAATALPVALMFTSRPAATA